MKGDVLHYDDNVGTGQISGADGIRYSFTRADLKQLIPISRGTKVDFDFDGKVAKEIYIDNPAGAAAHASAHAHAHASAAPGAPAEPRLGLWGYYIRAYTSRFAKFSGRARRKEYWAVAVFSTILMTLFYALIFAGIVGRPLYSSSPEGLYRAAISSPISVAGMILIAVYGVLSILPFVGLLFRRLHDIGWPGWIALIVLAIVVLGAYTTTVFADVSVFGIIGSLALLIVAFVPGNPAENKYGPSPK